jgi:hypothetical protein
VTRLAEAHYSFLQMSLDPHIPAGLHSLPQRYNIKKAALRAFSRTYCLCALASLTQYSSSYFLPCPWNPHIPAGLHSLPQRYNIPTRLWQVAFHQLLERMRIHAARNTATAGSSKSCE